VLVELFERIPATHGLARALEAEQLELSARVRQLLGAQVEATVPEFSQPLA
jgi:hypothetical protein